MPPNPFLLAADNSPDLLPLLRENPALASGQDQHGYSLIHAAASYDHLDLLRALVHEFKVPIDLRDEDGETALFVVENVAAARALVELGLDPEMKNDEGQTAREKIEAEAEFPDVARFLAGLPSAGQAATAHQVNGTDAGGHVEVPRAPEGLEVTVSTVAEPSDAILEPDPEFRRRIEELAAREDFHTDEGQARLRQLVQDALSDQGLSEEREVRRSRQA